LLLLPDIVSPPLTQLFPELCSSAPTDCRGYACLPAHAQACFPGFVPELIAKKFASFVHSRLRPRSKHDVKTIVIGRPALRTPLRVSLFVIVMGVAAVAHASGRWSTLEAIHQLENPRDLSRPGPRGELGAYQFRSATWSLHTDVPFQRALERPMSDLVAGRHYDWLSRRLEAAGLRANPYNIALAWNGGITAAVKGRSSRAAHAYATRAANLAAAFEQEPPSRGGP
jgi:hypothetical protein